jgi:hypothetical protein
MIFKAKDKKLIGTTKKAVIEFGAGLIINDVKIDSPGEYEVAGVLITVPTDNIYSLHTENNLHIVYWHARGDKLETKSEELGSIDALVLAISDDIKTAANIVSVLNELEPTNIVLANANLKDEIRKTEQISVETVETWKAMPTLGENNRQLILLPCSNE